MILAPKNAPKKIQKKSQLQTKGGAWMFASPNSTTPTVESRKLQGIVTHRIHGTDIFAYIYHKNQPFM